MKSEREDKLEELVKELLYLVNETTLPRCEFYRRAAEATLESNKLLLNENSHQ